VNEFTKAHQKMSTATPQTGRLLPIDGLRGFAAFVVLLWHATVVFFPAVAFGKLTSVSHQIEISLSRSPLTFFMSGTFAVACFFVISGYVLTISYLRHGDIGKLTDTAIARFPRLFFPAAFSTILMFSIYWFGNFSGEGSLLQMTGTIETIDLNAFDLKPTGKALVSNIFWLPWFGLPDYRRIFSGVLWTMSIELWCSFIVMGFAVIFRGRRGAAAAILAIAILFVFIIPGYGVYMATFFIGTAIAVLDPKPVTTPVMKVAFFVLFLAGCWAAGYTGVGWTRPLAKLKFSIPGADFGIILKSAGGIVIFLAVIQLGWLTKLFSSPPFLFLGRVSFSLYLCHMFVIVMVGRAVFALLGTGTPLTLRGLVAFAATIIVSLGCAVVVTRYVDDPAIRFSRYFARVVLRRQPEPARA
jgi:peptidoglycan/LPS O-acetylase OafA/YrhL